MLSASPRRLPPTFLALTRRRSGHPGTQRGRRRKKQDGAEQKQDYAEKSQTDGTKPSADARLHGSTGRKRSLPSPEHDAAARRAGRPVKTMIDRPKKPADRSKRSNSRRRWRRDRQEGAGPSTTVGDRTKKASERATRRRFE